MKIDKEFLNKIYYNGDLNKKQLDILNIDFSSEKNYENKILGKGPGMNFIDFDCFKIEIHPEWFTLHEKIIFINDELDFACTMIPP